MCLEAKSCVFFFFFFYLAVNYLLHALMLVIMFI